MRRVTADGILAALMAVTTACVIWVFFVRPALGVRGSTNKVVASGPVQVSTTSSIGQAADVIMVEFSDFQCPFCVRFSQETLPTLRREYVEPGKVQILFANLPIRQLHPLAYRAAEASECAGSQGQFPAMHDSLFERSGQFGQETFSLIADRLPIDHAMFEKCMSGMARESLEKQSHEAALLGVRSTPTFVFARRNASGGLLADGSVVGAQTIDVFRQKLDRMLSGH